MDGVFEEKQVFQHIQLDNDFEFPLESYVILLTYLSKENNIILLNILKYNTFSG